MQLSFRAHSARSRSEGLVGGLAVCGLALPDIACGAYKRPLWPMILFAPFIVVPVGNFRADGSIFGLELLRLDEISGYK